MNYTVHGRKKTHRPDMSIMSFFRLSLAMMYSYYALRALRFRIPKWAQITVTIFQLSQMGVGCFVNYKAFTYKEAKFPCDVAYSNIFWSFFMYFVYLLLFLHFFIVNYVIKKPSRPNVDQIKKKT